MDKKELYQETIKQVKGLLEGETDLIANLANVSAVLKEKFDFWWVGFYLVHEDELVLGPFQGPVACTRIGFGKGVCGKVFQTLKPEVVKNVEEFPGHIACSSESKSEIVIPLMKYGELVGVLDVDSDKLDDFDDTDVEYLTELVSLLA